MALVGGMMLPLLRFWLLLEVGRSFVSVRDGTHSGVCHVDGPQNFYVVYKYVC